MFKSQKLLYGQYFPDNSVYQRGSNGWSKKTVIQPSGCNGFLFCLKENLCMAPPQQERKRAGFFSVSHCHCAVTPYHIWPPTDTLSKQKEKSLKCGYAFVSVFPGLSHGTLWGCDTNPYKASIIEMKVDAADADDIQRVSHLTPPDPGILPSFINNSFTEGCCHGDVSKHCTGLKICCLGRKEVCLGGALESRYVFLGWKNCCNMTFIYSLCISKNDKVNSTVTRLIYVIKPSTDCFLTRQHLIEMMSVGYWPSWLHRYATPVTVTYFNHPDTES